MMETIRILVVDDHPLLREGVSITLDSEPDFEVVGQGENYADALRMAKTAAKEKMIADPSPANVAAFEAARAALEWQIELGATEAIGDAPVDRYALAEHGRLFDGTADLR